MPIFVLDTKKESIAVTEANKLGIPVVAVVDTNVDPELVQYPIPGNDDAIRANSLLSRVIADAVEEGRFIAAKRDPGLGSGRSAPPSRRPSSTSSRPPLAGRPRRRRPPASVASRTPAGDAADAPLEEAGGGQVEPDGRRPRPDAADEARCRRAPAAVEELRLRSSRTPAVEELQSRGCPGRRGRPGRRGGRRSPRRLRSPRTPGPRTLASMTPVAAEAVAPAEDAGGRAPLRTDHPTNHHIFGALNPMSFTAKDVQNLRQATGAGMMDAKKALEANDGDFEAAIQVAAREGPRGQRQAQRPRQHPGCHRPGRRRQRRRDGRAQVRDRLRRRQRPVQVGGRRARQARRRRGCRRDREPQLEPRRPEDHAQGEHRPRPRRAARSR